MGEVKKAKCERCKRLRDKSSYYKQRYIQAKERLEELKENRNLEDNG